PKDSFTENHNMNLGLIRKRIKDPNLWFKEVTVGRRSKTKVAIAYIKDIVELKRVNDIEKKLKQIDIDAILDSGYIRKFLEGKQRSTFPQMITTEKPDMVCGELLDGKLAIIVENTPFVLITPATLISFLHAPTDYYEKASNVTFSRILRTLAFFITIITPALYIALTTFNHELIPDEFLISIAMQQQGVPFPTVIEVLLFGITFEVLRESDLRAPSAAGTAMSIVGALVLGDAAVSAGVVSPIVVIIVAVTSICEMAFSDIDMINALRSWKIIFIFTSMFMGLIGFLVAMLILIIKLVSLETLDVPYLAPFSPIDIRAWKDSIIKFPVNRLTKRPRYLTDKNQTRLKEDK
ncbi:MAG: spore germination protein, partial [Bacilli bacterium]|nr:spore germination protein [Bacilli bacterium]